MRRDSADAVGLFIGVRAGLAVLALAALLAGCDSGSVQGSGSPETVAKANDASKTTAAATTSPAHKSPVHKAPARKNPAHKNPAHKAPAHKSSPGQTPTHNAPTHSAPTHQAPPTPHAADGRNLAACKGADCQVELVAGDHIALDPSFGLDEITVKSVGSEISMALSGHGQGLNLVGRDVSSGTNCTNGACTTTGSISLTPGMTGQINQIHITLSEVVGDRGIITMRPH